jgi:predicted transcriptional regulator of viral defense system
MASSRVIHCEHSYKPSRVLVPVPARKRPEYAAGLHPAGVDEEGLYGRKDIVTNISVFIVKIAKLVKASCVSSKRSVQF